MKSPKVSIIVVNFNGGQKTLDCLECLKKLDYPNYEVFVIDNGSNDGTEKSILSYKEFEFIFNKENLGLTKAMNIGIKNSSGEYILMIDQDAIIEKDFLKKMMQVILKNEKFGAVFPKVYFFNHPNVFNHCGSTISSITGKTKVRGFNEEDVGKFEKQVEVDYAPGTTLLLRRDALEKVGLMDEDYFVYYADADLCFKLRKAGYKIIYTPTTKSWHNSNMAENQLIQ